MASRLNIILEVISHYKYLITVVVGLLVVGVLDDNSFRKRIQYELQISELEDQIEQYNKQYERDSKFAGPFTFAWSSFTAFFVLLP